MLGHGSDAFLPRRSTESRKVDDDQAMPVGERCVEQRCEGETAVGNGVEQDERCAIARASQAKEQSVDDRCVHGRL